MKTWITSLAAVLCCHAALAQPDARIEAPVETLKAIYLECDARTRRELLPPGDAALCSMAAESLLDRGFSRDFNALLAWWREATRSATTASVDAPRR